MPKGRKSKVDLEDQKQVFTKYAEILQNSNIKSSDRIFLTISKELNFKMSPLALFISLKRNRHIFFQCHDSLLLKQTTGESHTIKSASNSSCLTNASFEDNDFDLENSKQKETKTFSYEMDLYDWKKIQPLYAYQRRTGTNTYKKYRTMPKFKWSNLLKENIYKYTKLPCTWTLKREKVVNNKIFVKGNCSQCTACVQIKSYATTDKIHTIFCKITNIDKNIKHNPKKKFKLTPYKRQQLAKILKYKSAIVVHNELASTIIGDKKDENEVSSIPALPSLAALRQIKSEVRKGQWFDSNPIISLLAMARSTHKNIIRSLSVHPNFFVYYWSEEQIDYYNQYLRKFERVTVTIDATGSFFQTMRLADGTKITKRLFLYAGLITGNLKLKSVPVLQMVTDAHGKQSILYWLNQWKRSIHRTPHEIISDDSSALVAASTEAFTVFSSTKEYIKNLFSILEGETSDVPSTFIRLDSSHFIKTLHNLKCFNDVDPRIKYFYIRCIMFLKKCEDFEIAKEVILDMIRVCLCQYDDDLTTSTSSDCQTSLSRLMARLKNIDLDHTVKLSCMDDDQLIYKTEEYHTAGIDFFVWLDDKIAQLRQKSMKIKEINKNYIFIHHLYLNLEEFLENFHCGLICYVHFSKLIILLHHRQELRATSKL
ncbi:hypothetical protein HF086_001246 [Spodoptera exigua]|uniref:Uncharacterized protein n=1 Tax=Spodoptera exigua TaxID=7107 RepID=A0A922MCS2_SPOEX|nr:hypothetical protein HF086_001246 [Spodoptera exigua]